MARSDRKERTRRRIEVGGRVRISEASNDLRRREWVSGFMRFLVAINPAGGEGQYVPRGMMGMGEAGAKFRFAENRVKKGSFWFVLETKCVPQHTEVRIRQNWESV